MSMNTMEQRYALIQELLKRGFIEGQPDPTGWRYQHPDGFFLRFNSQGRYTLDCPSGMRSMGVADEPKHILDIVDEQAAAL